MKKLIAFFLASVMVLSLLTGCNDKESPVDEEPKNVTVAETVIYDKKDITITVTGMTKTNLGVQFSVDVRNRSERNIIFTANYFVVNGITVGGGGFIACDADRSVQDTIYLYSSELEKAGIKTVATVRGMDCRIIDSNTSKPLYTFDFDLVTSAGADYQQEVNTDGDVLLDSNGIRILSKNFTHDVYGEASRLVMMNNTNRAIVVEAQDIKVNGIRVDGKLYSTVYMNSVCFSDLSLYSSALNEANIESVESISFKLLIADAKTFLPIVEPKEIVIAVD